MLAPLFASDVRLGHFLLQDLPRMAFRPPRWATEARRPPWACATNEGLERLPEDPNQGHLRLLRGRT